MLRLPTFDGSHYAYRVNLEGLTFHFRFQWNRRTLGWYITLSDSGGDTLVTGVRVVCNYPLFDELRDERLPLGTIVAVSLGEDDSDPGFDDLGNRVRILYMDALDRAAAEEERVALAAADEALVIEVAP